MQSCGRRQLVKGDWRAVNRAPIAALAVETLDRLPSDLGFTRDREIEDTHIGNSRCAPATKSIQAIKAASDRGLAAFHVLPHSKFKRVFHRAWPDLQRMKLLLPVARSCRVSFFLVFHRAWPDLQRMKLLLPVARSYRVSFLLVFHRAWPDLQRMKLLLPVARSYRVSFFLVFHRAWPDLQRMKLLLPGGAVLPGQFPPSHLFSTAPNRRT